MTIELDFQNPYDFKNLPSVKEFQRWSDVALQASATFTSMGDGNDELNTSDYSVVIRVTDESESKALNYDYRHKDAPTNVLSFPFETPDFPGMEEQTQPLHLGDLVFCKPLIDKEASQQEKTQLQHWAHLVIHGILHLQGFDHINDKDAKIMESLEISIMQQLNFPNPYE